MKKIVTIFFVILLWFPLWAETEKEVIALFDLEVNEVDLDEMGVLLDFVYSSLINTNSYTVIDRDQRDRMLDELKFSLSGLADEETALEAGKLLSARYILVGSMGAFGGRYLLNLRLISVETGETLNSVSEKYENYDDVLDDTDRLVKMLTRTLGSAISALENYQTDYIDFDMGLFDQTNYLIGTNLEANFQLIRERSRLLSPVERQALYDQNSRSLWKGVAFNTFPGFGVGSFSNRNNSPGVALLVTDIVAVSALFTGIVIGGLNHEQWKEDNSEFWIVDPDGNEDWNNQVGFFRNSDGNEMTNPSFKYYQAILYTGGILFLTSKVVGILIPSLFTKRHNDKLGESLNLYNGKESRGVSFDLRASLVPAGNRGNWFGINLGSVLSY